MAPETSKKYYLSWKDVTDLTYFMCDRINKTDFKPDLVVGIARGGLVPAVSISHNYKIPMIALNWQTRDGRTKDIDHRLMSAVYSNKKVLFVDDINDSGCTFQELYDEYVSDKTLPENIKFACIIERSTTRRQSDFVGTSLDNHTWVVFPWERIFIKGF